MGLTKTQLSIINKAQAVGGSKQGVALDDEQCAYLVAVVARDLGALDKLSPPPSDPPPFFAAQALESLRMPGVDFLQSFEQLLKLDQDADAYFDYLASLHKARLKYERILQTQPLPTVDQVGPRGLLQYGCMATKALTPFLLWRKWLYDIDNRAPMKPATPLNRSSRAPSAVHRPLPGRALSIGKAIRTRGARLTVSSGRRPRDQAARDDRSLWARSLGRGAGLPI